MFLVRRDTCLKHINLLNFKWHIRVETPIGLHSVAHRVSHQIPAESEMLRQHRATPPRIKVSHLSPNPAPPVALSCLIRSRQEAKGGGVLRRAGGGYRGIFGFRKQIALQGVSQLQSDLCNQVLKVGPVFGKHLS